MSENLTPQHFEDAVYWLRGNTNPIINNGKTYKQTYFSRVHVDKKTGAYWIEDCPSQEFTGSIEFEVEG